ncbi:hypothetical protein BCM20_002408 [Clostridium beijerinckii]|nr:hypothetical protein [Clostridium beijerinckii]NYC02453.1 hypothetical protein [Clostridium beijerinckii]
MVKFTYAKKVVIKGMLHNGTIDDQILGDDKALIE